MFDDLSDLYQQVILDHCKHPRNFHEMENATCSAQGRNPLCGDQLKLYVLLDGEIIRDLSFLGSGCCISKASASLLTENLKGKTKAEVQKVFDQVHEMVTTGEIKGDVGKLAVFAGVYKFPARVKCAILAWHAVKVALSGGGEPVSTETEDM
ncbi:MAG TPA: SUF system NifU family Fe-S cluster assembly protein [Verrucomicrobiae bacterium]|nr:SUF system NifU family Fe-S cluster assembly protein [Verrucomicrobiae bacterium]